MDKTELQKLFEVSAELNSPEVKAAQAELKACLEEQKQIPVETLEIKPYVSYTASAEYKQDIHQVQLLLQAIREAQEAERLANIESEKASEKRDKRTFVIAILTLLSTIVTVGIGIVTLWLQFHQ